jgi:SAM-dependent methyltransferase
MKKRYLPTNEQIIRNKNVLDLACHTGESTKIIHELGAEHVYAVEVRPDLIKIAQQNLVADNVQFMVEDITNYAVMSNLVAKSNTITCLGVLYHLFDHFRFLECILQPNIEHVLIETEFGPESLNPEMYWGFETIDHVEHGWHNNVKIIPNGAPNLSWILQSADIFNFKCDWIQHYGRKQPKKRKQVTKEEYLSIAGPNWPSYADLISDKPIPDFVENEIADFLQIFTKKRMIIRLYNSNLVNSTPLSLKEIYQWSPSYFLPPLQD